MENKGVSGDNITEETIRIFVSLTGFFGIIKKVFGNIDKKKNTKRKLKILKQKRNTSNYVVEF